MRCVVVEDKIQEHIDTMWGEGTKEERGRIMDIIIYTRPEVLEHKKGADGYQRYYWEFSKFPKNIKIGDRIFFAVKGFIQGSFKIDEIHRHAEGDDKCLMDNNKIVWDKDSWIELEDKIPTKHFQGFRYRFL